MTGNELWKSAVRELDMSDDEREQLLTWDDDCINGVQWSGGDVNDIDNPEQATQAVVETLDFVRRNESL